MTENSPEEALRQADALMTQAVTETEARCGVLAQFVNDCEAHGSKTSAWSDALREFHALHAYRSRLLGRQNLIHRALDYPVGERPAPVPLPSPERTVRRTQQQVQVQVQVRAQRRPA